MADPRVLVLAGADNVGTAIQDIPAGARLEVAGAAAIVAAGDIQLGHKLAIKPIARGQKIVKYGAPIGSATRDIAPGEHVHTHNIQSDYLPTFGRDGTNRLSGH